jgi:hypothetical protein
VEYYKATGTPINVYYLGEDQWGMPLPAVGNPRRCVHDKWHMGNGFEWGHYATPEDEFQANSVYGDPSQVYLPNVRTGVEIRGYTDSACTDEYAWSDPYRPRLMSNDSGPFDVMALGVGGMLLQSQIPVYNLFRGTRTPETFYPPAGWGMVNDLVVGETWDDAHPEFESAIGGGSAQVTPCGEAAPFDPDEELI